MVKLVLRSLGEPQLDVDAHAVLLNVEKCGDEPAGHDVNPWRAREIVREHCVQHDVPYTETSLSSAWKRVIEHLNVVGHAAPRVFECPVAMRYSGT